MKKTVSLLLALALLLSVSVVAFAAEGVGNGGSDSASVKGTYKGKAAAVVYSVDIAWEGLEFTYNGAYDGEWNPATHSYDNSTEAGWAEGTGTITVTNHSNIGITAVPSYTAESGYEDAGMSFSTSSLVVATADNGVDGAAGQAVTGTITVSPTGKLPEGTENATIGTITITIS